MKFVPGQVVNLKSGGQPLTVVAVDGDSVECMWLGEEGDLFRESIPAIAIELAFGDDTANLDSADEREFANANASPATMTTKRMRTRRTEKKTKRTTTRTKTTKTKRTKTRRTKTTRRR